MPIASSMFTSLWIEAMQFAKFDECEVGSCGRGVPSNVSRALDG
jgi:hypothetical protein